LEVKSAQRDEQHFLARFSHGFPRAKPHNDTFLIHSFTSHLNHTSQHISGTIFAQHRLTL